MKNLLLIIVCFILSTTIISCKKDPSTPSNFQRKYLVKEDIHVIDSDGSIISGNITYRYDAMDRLISKRYHSSTNSVEDADDSLIFVYSGTNPLPVRREIYDLLVDPLTPETTYFWYNIDSTIRKDSSDWQNTATYYSYPSANKILLQSYLYDYSNIPVEATITTSAPYCYASILISDPIEGATTETYSTSSSIMNPLWFGNSPIQFYLGCNDDDPDSELGKSGKSVITRIASNAGGYSATILFSYTDVIDGYPGKLTITNPAENISMTIQYTYR